MAITYLREGSIRPEVIDLQYLLLNRGGATEATLGQADGIFGPKTKAAVLTFQTNKALIQDGIVGPKTWEVLAALHEWPNNIAGEFLREGDRGDGVKRLQQGMQSKGVYTAALDGIFGPLTKAAVLQFQTPGVSNTNIVGIVGPYTYGGAIGD